MHPAIRQAADLWNGWIWFMSWGWSFVAVMLGTVAYYLFTDPAEPGPGSFALASVAALLAWGAWRVGRSMRIGVYARMRRY